MRILSTEEGTTHTAGDAMKEARCLWGDDVMAGISHTARLLAAEQPRQQLQPRLQASERANHGWPRLLPRLPSGCH